MSIQALQQTGHAKEGNSCFSGALRVSRPLSWVFGGRRECWMGYLYLVIAIVGEVVATSALKASECFTKPLPSLLVVVGYCVAFYFLSVCLESISVGVAYAMWSGLGVVLVTAAAAILYKQLPDMWAVLGMTLIVAGVLVLNLLSKSAAH